MSDVIWCPACDRFHDWEDDPMYAIDAQQDGIRKLEDVALMTAGYGAT